MARICKTVTNLFEVWCEVELLKDQTSHGNVTGKILRSFPSQTKNEQLLKDIVDFTFPCHINYRSGIQHYTFVLTDITSHWKFGFCRFDSKTNRALVIVTLLDWHNQFIKFIDFLAKLEHNNSDELSKFLPSVYARKIPEPGTTFQVTSSTYEHSFTFVVPWKYTLLQLPEDYNLSNYYNYVETENMINIFVALLNERRIIFTSSRLNVLSSCVIAASELIYPMVWQHIFVPILPMKLKEYVNAPMPFLIGIPEPILQVMNSSELTDVVFFDCDTNHFVSPYDDKKNFPKYILEGLRKKLSDHTKLKGDVISRSFLRAIVQLIGGYRDGLQFSGGTIEFNDRQFIAARPQRLRGFLEKILELQIFRQFIDARLVAIKEGFSDEFEAETKSISEVQSKKFNIVKNIKDLTNPALATAVQSAKQSGRNVKNVMKGLKTKMTSSKDGTDSSITRPDLKDSNSTFMYELDIKSSKEIDSDKSNSASSSSYDLYQEMQSEGFLLDLENEHSNDEKTTLSSQDWLNDTTWATSNHNSPQRFAKGNLASGVQSFKSPTHSLQLPNKQNPQCSYSDSHELLKDYGLDKF